MRCRVGSEREQKMERIDGEKMKNKATIARLIQFSKGDNSIRHAVGKLVFSFEQTVGTMFLRRHPEGDKRLLNLGCGLAKYDEFLNADCFDFRRVTRKNPTLPDWTLDCTKLWKCNDGYFEGVYTEHMLEHMSYAQGIFVLQEIFRTLADGGWLRVIVPNLRLYCDYYEGRDSDKVFSDRFESACEAFSSLTQHWGHVSVWDAKLLMQVLSETGFGSVKEVEFGIGTDKRLIKDTSERRWESLYVEAQKPGNG